mgnify:CR=1 FL=1
MHKTARQKYLLDILSEKGEVTISELVDKLQVSADTSVEQALFSAYQTMLGSRCATETLSRDEKGRQTRTQTEFDTLDRIRVSNDQVSFVILPEGTRSARARATSRMRA